MTVNRRSGYPPAGAVLFDSFVSSCAEVHDVTLTASRMGAATHFSHRSKWTLLGSVYGNMLHK